MWSDTLDTCVKHEISCDFYFLLCNSIVIFFFFCVVFVEDGMVLRCPKVGPGCDSIPRGLIWFLDGPIPRVLTLHETQREENKYLTPTSS